MMARAWNMVPNSIVCKAWLKTAILSQLQTNDVQKLYGKYYGTVGLAVQPPIGFVTSIEDAAAAHRSSQTRKEGEGWLESVDSEINEQKQRPVRFVLNKDWGDENMRLMTEDLTLLTYRTDIYNLTKAYLNTFLEYESALYASEPIIDAAAMTLAAAEGLGSDGNASVFQCIEAADVDTNVEVSGENEIRPTISLSKLYAAWEYFKKEQFLMLDEPPELMKGF